MFFLFGVSRNLIMIYFLMSNHDLVLAFAW